MTYQATHSDTLPTARSKRRSRSGLQMTMNLAPMIDVTFLLLTFFLVTTTFKPAEGVFAAVLPKDAGAPSAALPISPIVVRISQVNLGGYLIRIDNATRSPQTFDELARFLVDFQANPGFDRQTPVVIYPGSGVEWGLVVNAWNAAVRAKCANITFAGQ